MSWVKTHIPCPECGSLGGVGGTGNIIELGGLAVKNYYCFSCYSYKTISFPQRPLEPTPTIQGEPTLRYQLIEYNFVDATAKATGFKTLEEAQNALNTRVAALQSSLTTKSFYTLSLLDAQTGGFLGFTTQAPPAVALAGATATS